LTVEASPNILLAMSTATDTTVLDVWLELCDNPRFQGIPYKIETDENGRILMSPTQNYHGYFASRINRLLEKLMPNGTTGNEVAVVTTKGIKVPDSVWVSPERYQRTFSEAACSIAPEVCVEILSRGNSEREVEDKRVLYLAAGALEVWVCDAHGSIRFFISEGEAPQSRICPRFPRNIKPSGA